MSQSFTAQQANPHTDPDVRNEADVQRHDRVQVQEQESSKMAGGNTDITVSQRMVSATIGSVLTSLLVTPLDVVRVRLQSQNPTPSPLNLSKFSGYTTSFKQLPQDLGTNACCREVFWVGNNGQFCLAGNGNQSAGLAADCAVEEHQRKTYSSTMDGLKKIAKNEGLTTLWRGLSPTLVMAIPANVIYFTGYDWLRYSDASPIRKVSGDAYTPLTAGAVARVLAAVAVSPVEMFRTRMQASSGTTGVFRDTLHSLHRMTQTQGYTSLWRGLGLTMWRDVPFSGIYWWGYEATRNAFTDLRTGGESNLLDTDRSMTGGRASRATESHAVTFVDSFVAGGISGAFASFVTTPFDVGKTRQQTFRHAGDDAGEAAAAKAASKAGKVIPEEMTMPRFLYHIYREEGASGLLKGWGPRCLKVAPACAIMISSYEVGKRWARGVNERKLEKAAAL